MKKTPLKRTGKLRKTSAKQAGMIEEMREERDKFAADVPACASCGATMKYLEIHEIYGGSQRQKTYRDRRFWLLVCWLCHMRLQSGDKATALALKAMTDSAYYDRAGMAEVLGHAVPTEAEVIRAAYQLGGR